jgi:hypothetical protein
MIAGLGFDAPLILLALVALPILWWLLRAIPPAPILRRFPGVALLIGLADRDTTTDRTPWWLLLLRALAIGAAIIGFAGPVLAPQTAAKPGTGPLLILMDGGWADAPDWATRASHLTDLLDEAQRQGRPVALASLAEDPQPLTFQTAEALAGRAAALQPKAWTPTRDADWVTALPEGSFETRWLSDGLTHAGQPALTAALLTHGPVRVTLGSAPLIALRPPVFDAGSITLTAVRPLAGPATSVDMAAIGPDPTGVERDLTQAALTFADGATEASVTLDLPPELRNRIARFDLPAFHHAGAVALTDDSLKRRKVALVSDAADKEGLQLLSPLHYLRKALEPSADLIEGGITDVLPAKPDVIVLADVAQLTADEQTGLQAWVSKGGLLMRFAGPRLAAADPLKLAGDPLMPVRLRGGGKSVGGAMSWGEPKHLAAFPETSPFHGLPLPDDLRVQTQVLAEPDADLTANTIAALDDGTPLVTRKAIGQGQVVLFHVTANADWSNLPLSGLFVQMLDRLAVSSRPGGAAADLAGQTFVPRQALDGFGRLANSANLAGVPGEVLAKALTDGPGAGVPPGLYATAERAVALNALGATSVLAPAAWPAGVTVEGFAAEKPQDLKGGFLGAALALALLDILAALLLSGRLAAGAGRGAVTLLALMLALGAPVPQARAQDLPLPAGTSDADARAIRATEGVVLAYVVTGDPAVDKVSEAGLKGLSDQLWARTAVEPLDPMGVDPAKDELAFFPFLYWPVTATATTPDAATYERLNRYLRNGGMILFDTRDGDGSANGSTPETQALQRIAAGLDIPPIEPIPQDHVLTRSFYLLQQFPGRYVGAPVWVEAAPPDAEQAKGMPFRNLNDGVTPVVIGGNDWASAWAVDEAGTPLLPVGRGDAGETQREYAYRFGVNLIMYVLTGNYKSDQVHVPALLERLGQ